MYSIIETEQFVQWIFRGNTVIVMLGGGDKSSQRKMLNEPSL